MHAALPLRLAAFQVRCILNGALEFDQATLALPPISVAHTLTLGAFEIAPRVSQLVMPLTSLHSSSLGPQPATKASDLAENVIAHQDLISLKKIGIIGRRDVEL